MFLVYVLLLRECHWFRGPGRRRLMSLVLYPTCSSPDAVAQGMACSRRSKATPAIPKTEYNRVGLLAEIPVPIPSGPGHPGGNVTWSGLVLMTTRQTRSPYQHHSSSGKQSSGVGARTALCERLLPGQLTWLIANSLLSATSLIYHRALAKQGAAVIGRILPDHPTRFMPCRRRRKARSVPSPAVLQHSDQSCRLGPRPLHHHHFSRQARPKDAEADPQPCHAWEECGQVQTQKSLR